MSTLPITAAPIAAGCGTKLRDQGVFGRLIAIWTCSQARAARAVVDRHLKRFTDEELREMGYTAMDVARIRAMSRFATQDWL